MNQTVMITGATKGLGKELALYFAQKGFQLALCARSQQAIEEVASELRALGANVLALEADISNVKDVERFVAVTEATFQTIDVLINNASIVGPSPMPYLLDYPEDDFEKVMRVNAFGPFFVTRRVLPLMLKRNKGSIINVTSEAGHTGFPGWGAYGISKFALEGLTKTWAEEVAHSKVTVNMVDPGEMDTQMHAKAVPDCDYELKKPKDVVPVFAHLVSAKCNGQRIVAESFLKERGLVR
ncbi:3-oxoacyl-ACP reductase [Fictibacillus macauensis ZFHKF-1]|uniref:3-oxoacyl-ACP reductase n=1 Tax=Fictibacillus macauensis ZFHKF-1 TaxID=1196324 RepID=I8AN20_9BACL|nr:SDR family oxidoreductase [Fictibacillus macauensis]EIT87407.1 3-oxoacyl-ACP reductase [Fictibacillus macauensis ZFHKF-1]